MHKTQIEKYLVTEVFLNCYCIFFLDQGIERAVFLVCGTGTPVSKAFFLFYQDYVNRDI